MGVARQTSLPASEPVSLEETKLVVRQSSSSDDAYLEGLIVAAREHCETITNRCIARRTWVLPFDAFPICQGVHLYSVWQEIEIPRPPLVSVDEIRYIDIDGAPQTLQPEADLIVDRTNEPGRISPVSTSGWPATLWGIPNAVAIMFTAGYNDDPQADPENAIPTPGPTAGQQPDSSLALAMPECVRTAMLQLIVHWYHNREPVAAGIITEVPLHVTQLLNSIKANGFFA